MAIYKDFIPENVAPKSAKRIGVYDKNGNRVFGITLGSLAFPVVPEKLYSFGAISDVHVVYTTGADDLKNTLNYFNNETDAEFICISGDLASVGTDDELSQYKNIVDQYSNIPVYVSAGNHDSYDANHIIREDTLVSESMQKWTGKPLYYSFEHGDDVFIFVGVCIDTISVAEIQWLYETLEKYRNRRCFLFHHVFAFEGCGNIFGLYTYNLTTTTNYAVFKSLLRHYKNIVWFHGHSHTMFHGQEFGSRANLDRVFGCHSVHVPSNAVPRTDKDGDYDFQIEYQESEGYLVDVYKNGIHLRGRDFVGKKFLPIASYWLDTTPVKIEANTFVDQTGTIFTGNAINGDELAIIWNNNTQVSSTGMLQTDTNYMTSDIIAIEDGYTYTVYGTDIKEFSIYPQWYKEDMSYIGVGQIADGHGWAASTTGNATYVVNPPSDAKYFRLQGWVGTNMGVLASNVTVKRTKK